MTTEITYNEALDALHIEVTGSIDINEILRLKDQLLAHPNFTTNIDQIFDCSESSLNLSFEELQITADAYSAAADRFGRRRKLALIVQRDLDYGKTRQYEMFFDSGPEVLIRTFKTLEDAQHWIGKTT